MHIGTLTVEGALFVHVGVMKQFTFGLFARYNEFLFKTMLFSVNCILIVVKYCFLQKAFQDDSTGTNSKK